MSLNAIDAIDAAKIRVQNAMPFFVDVLFRLRPVEKQGLGTLAIDAGLRLYYDPVAVEKWIVNGPERLARPLLHEIDHWLRLLVPDMKSCNYVGRYGDRDPILANTASDLELNSDHERVASAHNWLWPDFGRDEHGHQKKALMPAMYNLPDGLTMEEYYARLFENRPSKNSSNALGSGACFHEEESESSGGGSDSNNPLPPPVSEGEGEIIRERVAQAVHEAARSGQGNIPAGLARWAEERLAPPRINYKRLLAKVIRGIINAVAGMFDYTRAKVGRRYMSYRVAFGSHAPIPPAMHRPRPRVGVVLDTSGSMGGFVEGSPLYRASCETIGIAKATGADVTVFAGDTEFTKGKVHDAKDLQRILVGGGGTDMRAGILEAAKEDLDILFVVTDAETGWPSKDEMPKGMEVMAIVVSDAEENDKVSYFVVPPYIPHIKVKL